MVGLSRIVFSFQMLPGLFQRPGPSDRGGGDCAGAYVKRSSRRRLCHGPGRDGERMDRLQEIRLQVASGPFCLYVLRKDSPRVTALCPRDAVRRSYPISGQSPNDRKHHTDLTPLIPHRYFHGYRKEYKTVTIHDQTMYSPWDAPDCKDTGDNIGQDEKPPGAANTGEASPGS